MAGILATPWHYIGLLSANRIACSLLSDGGDDILRAMQQRYGDTYRLTWTLRVNPTAAVIRNQTADGSDSRKILVIKDDVEMARVRMRLIAHQWPEDGPRIVVTSAFMQLPREMREAAVWHEIGHIHHEHIFKTSAKSQDELRKLRLKMVEKAKVLPEEREADAFAVKMCGKDATASFIQWLIGTRPVGDAGTWNEVGLRELQMRLKIIQES